MDPIQLTSSNSLENPFPLKQSDQAHIEYALHCLKEHKELRSTLSEKDFTILQADEKTSALFQEVFGSSRNQYSYDKILELRLDEWANLSENNQKAKERIAEFLHNSGQKELHLNLLSLTDLPDIWQHSAFVSRLQELQFSFNQISSLPSSIGHLVKLQELTLSNNRLTSLPDWIGNLVKLQTLYLSCNQFTSLPDSIGNLLQLQVLYLDNNQFSSLPNSFGNLINLQALYLSCNQLTSLPDSIGNFINLQVLYLNNNQFSSLPDSICNLINLQALYLDNNPNLTSFQEILFNLQANCQILLERCGLSSHVVEQVQTHMHMQGYRGPRIIFSIHEASTSSKSIEELLNELFTASETPPFLLPQEWNSMEFLKSWLSRLSNMADYNAGKGARRKALASLVLSFIRHAIQDPTFQEVFFTVLKEGSSTCGDRMALSILNLGIAYKLSQVDQKALKELASLLTRGSLALEILQEIASDKVKKLCGCDPIEVYLGYPVMLKEALKLPIDVEEMLYFRCSSLKKEDLEAAKNIVLARFADKEGLYKELCQRDLWIKALKENYPTKAEEIEAKQQTLSEAGNYDVQNIKEEWIALTKETLDSWTP